MTTKEKYEALRREIMEMYEYYQKERNAYEYAHDVMTQIKEAMELIEDSE